MSSCVSCRDAFRGARDSGVYRAALLVRGGVALRANPGALEALGTAADRRISCAPSYPRMGAGRAFPFHICGATFIVAHTGSHGADGMGVHYGASPLAPMKGQSAS